MLKGVVGGIIQLWGNLLLKPFRAVHASPMPSCFADLPKAIKYRAVETLILFPVCPKAVISVHTVRGLCQPAGADSNPVSWALPNTEHWKVARTQSLKKTKHNKSFLNSMRTAKPLIQFLKNIFCLFP